MSNIEKIRKWAIGQFPELTFISSDENEFKFSFEKNPEIAVRDNDDGTFYFQDVEGKIDKNLSIQDLAAKLFQAYKDFKSQKHGRLQQDAIDDNRKGMVALPTFKEYLKDTQNTIEDRCRAAIIGTIKNDSNKRNIIISKLGKKNEELMEVLENWDFEKKEARPDIGDGFYNYTFFCPSCDLREWMQRYFYELIASGATGPGAQIINKPVATAMVTVNESDFRVYEVVYSVTQNEKQKEPTALPEKSYGKPINIPGMEDFLNKNKKNTTTDYCKAAIVAWIMNHPGHVAKQFVGHDKAKLDEEDMTFEEPSQLVKNWKRMSKDKATGNIYEYAFDCVPYDSQLRAYVVIDVKTFEIYEISVQGE